MSDDNFDRERDELGHVAEWLREQRPEASAQDLDRIKLQAKSRAEKRVVNPRRTLSTVLASGVLALGLGGALAIAGKGPPASPDAGSSKSSAAHNEYRPGKGCGDKNHKHDREDECKKPPK
jgi:hypothetical protein